MTWKLFRKTHNGLKADRPELELLRSKMMHRLLDGADKRRKIRKHLNPASGDNADQVKLINEEMKGLESEEQRMRKRAAHYEMLLNREKLIRMFTDIISPGPSSMETEFTAFCLRRIITRDYASELIIENLYDDGYFFIPNWKVDIVADRLSDEVQKRFDEMERNRSKRDPDCFD